MKIFHPCQLDGITKNDALEIARDNNWTDYSVGVERTGFSISRHSGWC